jgi:hypothetical protein
MICFPIVRIAALALSVLQVEVAAAGNAQNLDACAVIPLFQPYLRQGALQRSVGAVKLDLVADAHSADCGTPDNYGTRVTVELKTSSYAGRCEIAAISVQTRDFDSGEPNVSIKQPISLVSHKQRFYIQGKSPDLAQPISRLILRSTNGKQALVFTNENFFYFKRVSTHGVLNTHLPSSDDNEDQCCWGASAADSHFR